MSTKYLIIFIDNKYFNYFTYAQIFIIKKYAKHLFLMFSLRLLSLFIALL